jgi:KaiC/GvpD/RAD55 family RecA-like ATPase
MSSALVDFVIRFRERERENARRPLTLEIAEGVRVVADDRTHRPPPTNALEHRSPEMRA